MPTETVSPAPGEVAHDPSSDTRKHMTEEGEGSGPVPLSIRKKLQNPPILPGESTRDFNSLFRELEFSVEERGKTAADYTMAYQATVLISNLQRLERMRVGIIRHFQPAAVATLLRRTSKYSHAEPGSIAYHEASAEAVAYFA